MPSNSLTISAIIVTWNGKHYVDECLSTISAQDIGTRLEVIVVDNASSDGTPEMIAQKFPGTILLRNKENQGFARANNLGMQRSTGRYVCLINSDVALPPDCLSRMWNYMEEHPEVGLLGPQMLVPAQAGVARSYMRFPSIWNCLCHSLGLDSLFRRWRLFGGILMTDFRNDQTSEVDVLNGWFLMIRREALEEVGGLDERFFMYGEDIDWSYRFHKAGWKRVYLASAQAYHYGGASSAAAPTRFYIEMQKADIQFWKKHHGQMKALVYRSLIFLRELIRIIGHGFLFLINKRERVTAAMKVRRSVTCIRWLAESGIGGRVA